MATPEGSGPLLLKHDSPEMERYGDEVLAIVEKAKELGLLNPTYEADFINDDGDVYCDRERGDKKSSVNSSYFQIHRQLAQGRIRRREAEVRNLMQRILALHFCIAELERNPDQQPTDQETYQERIAKADQGSEGMGVTSLSPNLFTPGSLGSQVKKNRYNYSDDHVREYLLSLAAFLGKQPAHLHALSNGINRDGGSALAAECMEHAADMSNQTVAEMCQENPAQVNVYLETLRTEGDTAKLTHFITDVGLDVIVKRHGALKELVHHLNETGQYDVLLTVLQSHQTAVLEACSNKHVKVAVGQACINLGWHLYGLEKNAEGVKLLETFCAGEIKPGGRDDTLAVYNALRGEM